MLLSVCCAGITALQCVGIITVVSIALDAGAVLVTEALFKL